MVSVLNAVLNVFCCVSLFMNVKVQVVEQVRDQHSGLVYKKAQHRLFLLSKPKSHVLFSVL